MEMCRKHKKILKVNLKILPRLTDSDSIKEVLVQYQKSLKAEFGDLIQKETDTFSKLSEESESSSEEDLKKIAEDFAVDTNSLKNKNDIIAALSEEGVTWAVYSKTLKDIEKAEAEDISDERIKNNGKKNIKNLPDRQVKFMIILENQI